MAEAFAKQIGAGIIEAESAGTAPADNINPTVRQVMAEIGYDMAGQYPKMLTNEMLDQADIVVTMGCGVDFDAENAATCPAVFVESEDWNLEDPANQPIEKVRQIRDEIKLKVEDLVERIRRNRLP